MKRTLLVVLLLVGLVGCVARMNRVMSSWVGNSYGNVIAAWGPPDQVLDDGSGGKILVYTRVRSYTAPGTATTQTSGTAAANGSTLYGTATSTTTYTPGQTYSWKIYRMFWLDKNGIVYRWSWRGF
jgi:hypothetical protein